MPAAEILTGCRARFKVRGQVIGYATGVSLREAITYEPVKTLDSIVVRQHEPVDYDCSMSAQTYRIVNETLRSLGLMPKHGQTDADFLTNILTNGEMSASLEDSKTGKIVALVEGVKIAEQDLRLNARGAAGSDVSFVCKRIRDEADLAV